MGRNNPQLNNVNDWHWSFEWWSGRFIVVLASPNSQRIVLVLDAIKLHQASCFFCCSKLYKQVAFVSVYVSPHDWISWFDAGSSSLQGLAKELSNLVVCMVSGDATDIDLP